MMKLTGCRLLLLMMFVQLGAARAKPEKISGGGKIRSVVLFEAPAQPSPRSSREAEPQGYNSQVPSNPLQHGLPAATPSTVPSQTYGAPENAPAPSQTYGAPENALAPSQTYGTPDNNSLGNTISAILNELTGGAVNSINGGGLPQIPDGSIVNFYTAIDPVQSPPNSQVPHSPIFVQPQRETHAFVAIAPETIDEGQQVLSTGVHPAPFSQQIEPPSSLYGTPSPSFATREEGSSFESDKGHTSGENSGIGNFPVSSGEVSEGAHASSGEAEVNAQTFVSPVPSINAIPVGAPAPSAFATPGSGFDTAGPASGGFISTAPTGGVANAIPAIAGFAPAGSATAGFAPAGVVHAGPATAGFAPAGPATVGFAPAGPATAGFAPAGPATAGFSPAGPATAGFAPPGPATAGFVHAGADTVVFAPAGSAIAGFAPATAGFAPPGPATAGFAPAGHATAGFAPAGHATAGFAPAGHATAGFAPAGHATAGFVHAGPATVGFAPAGHATAGFGPAGIGFASAGPDTTAFAPAGPTSAGFAPARFDSGVSATAGVGPAVSATASTGFAPPVLDTTGFASPVPHRTGFAHLAPAIDGIIPAAAQTAEFAPAVSETASSAANVGFAPVVTVTPIPINTLNIAVPSAPEVVQSVLGSNQPSTFVAPQLTATSDAAVSGIIPSPDLTFRGEIGVGNAFEAPASNLVQSAPIDFNTPEQFPTSVGGAGFGSSGFGVTLPPVATGVAASPSAFLGSPAAFTASPSAFTASPGAFETTQFLNLGGFGDGSNALNQPVSSSSSLNLGSALAAGTGNFVGTGPGNFDSGFGLGGSGPGNFDSGLGSGSFDGGFGVGGSDPGLVSTGGSNAIHNPTGFGNQISGVSLFDTASQGPFAGATVPTPSFDSGLATTARSPLIGSEGFNNLVKRDIPGRVQPKEN